MADANHLSLLDVMALHDFIMRSMGSNPAPLRAGGEGLLESAVMRPRMAEHYEGADLIRQAALLAVGISQAQAFLDGNKRTAFIACDSSLRENDLSSPGDTMQFARLLELVAERTDSLDAATERFEMFLRSALRRR